jgi:hypothetical protein
MPPQIKRLALLFALFIALFFVVRFLLLPESFGEFGHYRGQSLVENQEVVPKFAGEKACSECHQELADLKASGVHWSVSCETCHGPGLAHVRSTDSIAPVEVPKGREFCALCHLLNAARTRADIVQISLETHQPGENCTHCHNPHEPWQNIQ